ncbi:P-loop containing nucleoside triphosphate hydrolase protein [Laetiporus sulphureus 93-53]|uniref:p-loop containing nucleoside triphosphate hydrolase protein n=1 Tax=Laetiporus sulphureus 93-53 TaxID=1314785 RepID=A0A165BRA2_9APHY|nr:P-loop containing nucleoside triphosphate hydrolase protein [Laetiporus sulphureus 93-53]KZT01508.1 P-loop containing nucleoside triphosphate hydrolase protein [Laetiporus sulphureus 93-53]
MNLETLCPQNLRPLVKRPPSSHFSATIMNRKQKLIAVTGPTGTGKTSFINLASGASFKVGEGLQSCTQTVQGAPCSIAGENIVLIDTPGFDDTHKSQADVLKDIADFLEQTYQQGVKLSGIIYMHRISDVRMGGIARENFRLFTKICGKGAMKNVAIVTTMWEDVSSEVGMTREQELRSKPLFFKDAVDNGACMMRHFNNADSAMTVILSLIGISPEALRMQCELVDERIPLPQTEAAIELRSELEQKILRYKTKLDDLRKEMDVAVTRERMQHEEDMEEMRGECRMLKARVDGMQNELQKLREDESRGQATYFAVKERKAFGFIFWRTKSVIKRYRNGAGCLDDSGFIV